MTKCKLLVSDDRGYVNVNPDNYMIKPSNLFMFEMNAIEFSMIRSRFIARKYRYGDYYNRVG